MKVAGQIAENKVSPCSPFFKKNGGGSFFAMQENTLPDSQNETIKDEANSKAESSQVAEQRQKNTFFQPKVPVNGSTVKQEEHQNTNPPKQVKQTKKDSEPTDTTTAPDNRAIEQVEQETETSKGKGKDLSIPETTDKQDQAETQVSQVSEQESKESEVKTIQDQATDSQAETNRVSETSQIENKSQETKEKQSSPNETIESKPAEAESKQKPELHSESAAESQAITDDRKIVQQGNSPEELKSVQKELGLANTDHQQTENSQVQQAVEVDKTNCEKENSPKTKSAGNSMVQILSAPESALKPHAVRQALLILASKASGIGEVFRTGNVRRIAIIQHFNRIQLSLFSFVESNIAGLHGFILGQKNMLAGVSTNAIAQVSGVVANALARGMQQGNTFAANIHSSVVNTSSSITSRVNGIVTRIRNFVSNFPLPALPGIERLRNIAQNIVTRIVGTVQNALAAGMMALQNLLSRALSSFFSLVNRVGSLMMSLLQRVLSAILSMINRIHKVLQSIIIRVTAMLRLVLYTQVVPFINRMRMMFLQRIFQLETESVVQINEEAKGNLEAIASYLTDEEQEDNELPESLQRNRHQQSRVAISLIGAKTIINHLKTVALFKLRTLNLQTLSVSMLNIWAGNVLQRVKQTILRVFPTVLSRIVGGINRITALVQLGLTSVRALGSLLALGLAGMFKYFSNRIQQALTRIIELTRSAFERVRQSVMRIFDLG